MTYYAWGRNIDSWTLITEISQFTLNSKLSTFKHKYITKFTLQCWIIFCINSSREVSSIQIQINDASNNNRNMSSNFEQILNSTTREFKQCRKRKTFTHSIRTNATNTKTNVDKHISANKTQFEERNEGWDLREREKLRRGIEGGRVRLNRWWRGAQTRRGWWAGRRSSPRSASDPLAASFLWTEPFSWERIFGSRSQKNRFVLFWRRKNMLLKKE